MNDIDPINFLGDDIFFDNIYNLTDENGKDFLGTFNSCNENYLPTITPPNLPMVNQDIQDVMEISPKYKEPEKPKINIMTVEETKTVIEGQIKESTVTKFCEEFNKSKFKKQIPEGHFFNPQTKKFEPTKDIAEFDKEIQNLTKDNHISMDKHKAKSIDRKLAEKMKRDPEKAKDILYKTQVNRMVPEEAMKGYNKQIVGTLLKEKNDNARKSSNNAKESRSHSAIPVHKDTGKGNKRDKSCNVHRDRSKDTRDVRKNKEKYYDKYRRDRSHSRRSKSRVYDKDRRYREKSKDRNHRRSRDRHSFDRNRKVNQSKSRDVSRSTQRFIEKKSHNDSYRNKGDSKKDRDEYSKSPIKNLAGVKTDLNNTATFTKNNIKEHIRPIKPIIDLTQLNKSTHEKDSHTKSFVDAFKDISFNNPGKVSASKLSTADNTTNVIPLATFVSRVVKDCQDASDTKMHNDFLSFVKLIDQSVQEGKQFNDNYFDLIPKMENFNSKLIRHTLFYYIWLHKKIVFSSKMLNVPLNIVNNEVYHNSSYSKEPEFDFELILNEDITRKNDLRNRSRSQTPIKSPIVTPSKFNQNLKNSNLTPAKSLQAHKENDFLNKKRRPEKSIEEFNSNSRINKHLKEADVNMSNKSVEKLKKTSTAEDEKLRQTREKLIEKANNDVKYNMIKKCINSLKKSESLKSLKKLLDKNKGNQLEQVLKGEIKESVTIDLYTGDGYKLVFMSDWENNKIKVETIYF